MLFSKGLDGIIMLLIKTIKQYAVLSPQRGHIWNEKGLEKDIKHQKGRKHKESRKNDKMRTPEAPGDWGATCERGHTVNRPSQPLSM